MRTLRFALVAPFLAACAAPDTAPPTAEKLKGNVNPDGKHLVVVLDTSASMVWNDPKGYNHLGAHLAIALSGPEDNYGAVHFGDDAFLLSPLGQVGEKPSRFALHQRALRIPRFGQTNYVAALRWANATLESANAPQGSAVVFLTDGDPTVGGNEADILQAAGDFRKRGWPVYTIGLGPDIKNPQLLQQMAVTTRAASFRALKAEDLVTAFVQIIAQTNDFVIYDGKPAPVKIFPGTQRLVYIMIKDETTATIAALTRDGADISAALPTHHKFPPNPVSSIDLEAAAVERPETGTYDVRVDGRGRIAHILQRPPFTIRLDQKRLRSEIYENEPIDLAVLVESDSQELLDHIRTHGTARIVVRSEETETDLETVELKADAASRKPARFIGAAHAKLSRPGQAETQTLQTTFTYSEEGGGVWRRDIRFSVQIKAGRRPLYLTVAPKELDLGARWADAPEPASGEFTLSSAGDPLQAALRCDNPAFKVSTDRAAVGASPAPVRVTLDAAAAKPGAIEGAIEITAAKGEGEDPETARVAVRARLARLEGLPAGGGFSLGDRKQGDAADLPVGVRAEGIDGLSVSASPLSGPGTIETRVADGRLSVRIPDSAAAGEYKGEVTVRVPGLPDRKFPVSLKVQAVPTELALGITALNLSADKPGALEKDITLTLSALRDATVTVETGDLTSAAGKIRGGYVSFMPKGGWDGKTLSPGKEVAGTFAVEITSDHVNGEYAGNVTVTVTPSGGAPFKKEIPVKVKVQQ